MLHNNKLYQVSQFTPTAITTSKTNGRIACFSNHLFRGASTQLPQVLQLQLHGTALLDNLIRKKNSSQKLSNHLDVSLDISFAIYNNDLCWYQQQDRSIACP